MFLSVSRVPALNQNKCFLVFVVSQVICVEECLLQGWERTLDGGLSKTKPLRTPRVTSCVRTRAAQTLCSEVSVSVELTDGRRGGRPIRDWPLIRRFPFVGLLRWSYRMKLSSVVNNSIEWIFVFVCLFSNVPPTRADLHFYAASVRSPALLFSCLCCILLPLFSPLRSAAEVGGVTKILQCICHIILLLLDILYAFSIFKNLKEIFR